MQFMSVREASKEWNKSERWVQKLCEDGRISGVYRFGKSRAIPKDSKLPDDKRKRVVTKGREWT